MAAQVTVKIPAPSSMLVANVLGVLGLIGLCVAIGGLTHNVWWAVLVGAVELVGLSVVATMNAEPKASSALESTHDLVRPRVA